MVDDDDNTIIFLYQMMVNIVILKKRCFNNTLLFNLNRLSYQKDATSLMNGVIG